MGSLKQYNLNINNISGDTKIVLPFMSNIYPTGISESIENDFINDAIEESVNDITEFEKITGYTYPLL